MHIFKKFKRSLIWKNILLILIKPVLDFIWKYILNILIAPFENDASPSKPILYKLYDKESLKP